MKLKEPLSGVLHLSGALLSVAAAVLLILSGLGDPWKIVSFSVYCSSLLILYSFSTLYHWLPQAAGGKGQLFREGNDVTIIATGHLTWEALHASDSLSKKESGQEL